MNGLQLLLQILQDANESVPLITALAAHIQSGIDAGMSEDEIVAQGIAFCNDTKTITDHDRSDDPS